MASKTCYVIPTEEIALADQARRREEAINAGKLRAAALWKVGLDDLTARDSDYVTDFIPAPAGAMAGWLTQPLLVVGTWYSVFATLAGAVVTPVCPTNQVWVFYKVFVLTAGMPVCGLQFRTGTQANLKNHFDLENLDGKLVADGYFSQVVTYENPEIATVNVECRVVTPGGARVKLGTFIIETMQTTVV